MREISQRRHKRNKNARTLSVYDGQAHLGTIKIADDGTAVALDPNGKRLGQFPTFNAAYAAFDKPVERARCTVMTGRRIAFRRIADAALDRADVIVPRWLPGGRRDGTEWIARNPTRTDRRPGSFKVNLRTGRWGDFAVGDRGGDLISLGSYLFELPHWQAALKVADMLGIKAYEQ